MCWLPSMTQSLFCVPLRLFAVTTTSTAVLTAQSATWRLKLVTTRQVSQLRSPGSPKSRLWPQSFRKRNVTSRPCVQEEPPAVRETLWSGPAVPYLRSVYGLFGHMCWSEDAGVLWSTDCWGYVCSCTLSAVIELKVGSVISGICGFWSKIPVQLLSNNVRWLTTESKEVAWAFWPFSGILKRKLLITLLIENITIKH